jgi:thioredoxin 1
VAHLTDGNFESEVIESDTPVLVDFWADWCEPCKIIAPTIEALAEEYAGKVKIGKLNVDENPATASSHGIRGIPSLLVLKGGEVVGQAVGVRPRAELKSLIEEAL